MADGNENVSTDFQLVNRITGKTLFPDGISDDMVPEKKGEVLPLFSVYGMARGIVSGETHYGEWWGVTGMFEASRLTDGEIFRAPKLIIPHQAANMSLVEAVTETQDKVQEEGGPKKSAAVQFAFEVGIVKANRSGGSPYEWASKPLLPVGETDPLQALRSEISGALPAPA